ncbi:MAG TPA: response regulator [Candidatus Omnitrophota bacterium]|nr:response regulator [Candidatus Omnitrophota bacterium]
MVKKRILVIDDEKGFTAMLKLNLESTGRYDVLVENNPFHAVSAALNFMPHLILLDIIMPNMEGPDVAISLKENPFLKDIPVVFLTATVRKNEIEEYGGRIGGHYFVAKPSSLKEIMSSIEEGLSALN